MMITFPVYIALKQLLTPVAKVFPYTGQYQKGKGNTSYLVPAIYIEMPKDSPVLYTRGRRIMKPAITKIHYISNAPYSQGGNTQEAYLEQHAVKVQQIDELLQGKTLKRMTGREVTGLLTQQLLLTSAAEGMYIDGHVVTVLGYTTEMYAPDKWGIKPGTENPEISFGREVKVKL